MLSDQIRLEQLTACKIAMNLHQEAEELLNQKVRNGNGDLRYYLGVNYAAQRKYDESLTELLSLLKDNPSHQMARKMAFKLLIKKAHQKVKEKNFGDISSVLSTAVELAPDTPEARKELAYFNNVLPISYMKAGKREAAAKLWEEELRKRPTDHSLIHNLALLYYWWALSEEQRIAVSDSMINGVNSNIGRIWEKSISYWVMLLGMQTFWNEWKKEKEAIWNLEIKATDLEDFREAFLEEKLIRIFNNFCDLYKQNGKYQDSSRHEDYLLTLMLEKESALRWKAVFAVLNKSKEALDVNLEVIRRYELIRAFQKAEGYKPCFGSVKDCNKETDECLWSKTCQTDRNRELYFNIPAGRLFFQEAGMLDEVNRLIELLHKVQPYNESTEKLRFYLHPAGLGRVLILLEQGKNPHRAMAELQRLSGGKLIDKAALDVKCLYAMTHMERGRTYKFNEAMDDWARALGLLSDAKKISKFEGNASYKRLIAYLVDTINGLIVSRCVEEAMKYRLEGKLDDAIAVLLRGIKLVSHPANKPLIDLIVVFYCDKGDKLLADKNFSNARKEFEKALKFVPNYARAKKGIGTAYNNEAVENLNAISQHSTQDDNLNRCNEAIKLLKKALKILNPALEDPAIDLIIYAGDMIDDFVKDLAETLYKTVIENLVIAGKHLKVLRGY